MVDAEGNVRSPGWSYFDSEDCSGSPFIPIFGLETERPIGKPYKNPNIEPKVRVVSKDGALFFYNEKEIVRLHFQAGSFELSHSCSTSYKGTVAAYRTYKNDPSITGIEKNKLIISGIGESFSLSEEIGVEKRPNKRKVYANGIEIGTAFWPEGLEDDIYVNLHDFPGQPITLKKDGSYTGLAVRSFDLYYLDPGCKGSPYVKVLEDADKLWWDKDYALKAVIENNNSYYSLSTTVFKMSAGAKSKRSSYDGSCRKVTEELEKNGYKRASRTNKPDLPRFSPPITIEGYKEPTQYDELPEAT
ncbi:MAG: hypothetical protein HRU19_32340 [Pseudobacteriovorax sp.]|nr:hypothetical protein [Pseudobacteriovorax sp.]